MLDNMYNNFSSLGLKEFSKWLKLALNFTTPLDIQIKSPLRGLKAISTSFW